MRGTRGVVGALAAFLVFAAAGGCGGKKQEPTPVDQQTTGQETGAQPATDAGGAAGAGSQTIDNFTGNVQDQAGNPVGRGDGGEGASGREGPESGRERGTETR